VFKARSIRQLLLPGQSLRAVLGAVRRNMAPAAFS
jgi:hypothetical protein